MVRPGIALVFGLGTLILGACGGHEAEAPAPSGPPQDVKYRVLTTPQFAKPYVGKPVRTTAAFQMMPPQVGLPGKYGNGWVSVTFGDVEPSASGEYSCQAGAASPNLNMMVAGGVSVMAPTNIGQEFLSAKTGSVYELTGVLKENSTTYGGAYTMMFFEVTSLKVLAACKLQALDVQAREGGVLSGLKELGGQKVLDGASFEVVSLWKASKERPPMAKREATKAKTTTGKRGPGRPPKSEAKEKKTPASGERLKSPKKAPKRKTAIEVASSGDVEVISMRDINEVVDKLVDLYKNQEIRGSYELGELVVTELFGGDVDLIHQHGPKQKALSHLLQHQRLPCSPATLSRAVRVYELLTKFPQFKDHKQLVLGHFYAVIPLPDEKQEQLLEQAISKKWSAEDLGKEVAKRQEKELSGKPRGRHALPEGVKAFGAMERLFDKQTALRDLSFVEKLEVEDAERMKQAVSEIEAWCAQAKEALEKKLGVVETVSENLRCFVTTICGES